MNITDPRFKYVPSHLTDIRKTFAKHGWKPKEQHELKPDHSSTRGVNGQSTGSNRGGGEGQD
jgi:hypothetical protein